jgi:hypothetical protein
MLLIAAVPASGTSHELPRLQISEIVAAPQTDWNGDGRVTDSDEFIELHNLGHHPVDLAGWTLLLNDTTPEIWKLSGVLEGGTRRAFVNPPGALNNNAHVALFDAAGTRVDEVRYGTWPGATAVGAGSSGPHDEALRRIGDAWTKGHATPGAPPLEPFTRHAPPFESAAEALWDPGGRPRNLTLTWTDADRNYARAWLDVDGSGPWAVQPQILGGRWTATWNLTTPTHDFRYAFRLDDETGREWPSHGADVCIDAHPPAPPELDVPAWARDAEVPVAATPTPDAGVDGVQYLLQRWDHQAWTNQTTWTATPTFGAVPFQNATELHLRALARDAYGHTATGPPAHVRRDATPPHAIEGLQAEGYDRVTVTWAAPTDDESGAVTVHVRRTGEAGNRSWTLPAHVLRIEDEPKLGRAATYEAWAIDAAGNLGPLVRHEADHAGLYPHVRGIRANHDPWGPGTLRVHIDFDRAMDAATPRVLLQASGHAEPLLGRWLANRTTYLIELPSTQGRGEGDATLYVEAATDTRGRTLRTPSTRSLRMDASPPQLAWGDRDGWVNATGLLLTAVDTTDPTPVLRYRIDDGAWHNATGATRVPLAAQATIRAYAQDAAGWRTREAQRTLRVDDQAPTLVGAAWEGDRLRVRLADAGSGVDTERVRARTPEGRSLAITPVRGAFDLEPHAEILLVAYDRVGNRLEARIVPPSPPTFGDAAPLAAWWPSAAQGSGDGHTSHAHVGAATGGGVLALAAFAGLTAARAHRRRRAPSLAARLRRHRAASTHS